MTDRPTNRLGSLPTAQELLDSLEACDDAELRYRLREAYSKMNQAHERTAAQYAMGVFRRVKAECERRGISAYDDGSPGSNRRNHGGIA